MGADGKSVERRQSADHELLPCERPADARLSRKPGRFGAAYVTLAQKQRRTPDNDGVRSRSRPACRHRPMLPGRALAARFVRQNEIEVVRQNERLKGPSSVRAAQYGSYLCWNEEFIARTCATSR